MRPFNRTTPLPALYFYFFSVVEPSFTLIGAIFAILFPVKYFDESMSFQDVVLLGERGGGARGLLVTRALGNCFLLLALFSFTLLPTLTSNLHSQPVVHENILMTFFLCLILGDITHIWSTLSSVPTDVLTHPFSKWTSLLWGNVGFTFIFFVVRVMWFVGVGRPTYSLDSKKDKVEPRPKERAGAYGRVPQEDPAK
ncbi:hypothetical protein BDY24DRAFT_7390 [Mrakia frigida]|uniref:uncharacterized protein n=1 Tax=Mrakia frigida TaxID=29902 RepID=UPI003FCBFB9C